MLSNKPYLLRAYNEWIVDSSRTSILVLDATNPRCKIPKDFAEGGEIVFNVSPTAVRDLKLANDFIEFKASFSGVIYIIYAPINAVLAIYAEEDGDGIFFDADDFESEDDVVEEVVHLKSVDSMTSEAFDQNVMTGEPAPARGKPFLKLVE